MSLSNKIEQPIQFQNELKTIEEVENTGSQGGLAIRTDLHAGIGEDLIAQMQDGWQSLIDQLSSLAPEA